MNIIKRFISAVFCLFIYRGLSAQPLIETLLNIALENNAQIIAAKANYDSAAYSALNGGGMYAPGLEIKGSKTTKDEFSNSVTYSQPIPGGTSVQITGSYDYSSVQMLDTKYETRTPSVSFSVSQSLFPFWMSGHLIDPNLLSYQLQKEYCYNLLLYEKHNLIRELTQNCIYAVIEYNKIQSIKNSLNLLQSQSNALLELKMSGAINEAKFLELENSKWSYEQDLLTANTNYYEFIQKINTLCNIDYNVLSEEDIERLIPSCYSIDDFINMVKTVIGNKIDPFEASLQLSIQIIENNIISSKQKGAPALCVSAVVPFDIDNKKPGEWTLNLSLDVSPFFSSIAEHNIAKEQLDLQSSRNTYYSYVTKKNFLKKQYELFVHNYDIKIETLATLISNYEKELNDTLIQFEKGAVSQIDYETKRVYLENYHLTYESLIYYSLLYKILIFFVS